MSSIGLEGDLAKSRDYDITDVATKATELLCHSQHAIHQWENICLFLCLIFIQEPAILLFSFSHWLAGTVGYCQSGGCQVMCLLQCMGRCVWWCRGSILKRALPPYTVCCTDDHWCNSWVIIELLGVKNRTLLGLYFVLYPIHLIKDLLVFLPPWKGQKMAYDLGKLSIRLWGCVLIQWNLSMGPLKSLFLKVSL